MPKHLRQKRPGSADIHFGAVSAKTCQMITMMSVLIPIANCSGYTAGAARYVHTVTDAYRCVLQTLVCT